MSVDSPGRLPLLTDLIRLIVNSHFGKRSILRSGFLNKTNLNSSTEVGVSVLANAMRVNDSDRPPDLTPFWKSGTAFHRSTDTPVRDFIKFQATYPEFVGLEALSVAERKAKIQEKVNALYDPRGRRQGIPVNLAAQKPLGAVAGATAGSAAGGPILASKGVPPAPSGGGGSVGGRVAQAALSVQAAPPVAPSPHGDTPSTLTALQRLDWFIRVRVKKFQLKQSFTILFFLGPVPDKVEDWRPSQYLIGSHSEFVNSDPEHCTNCKDNINIITEGFIDLDDSLERLGQGQVVEEKEIEDYIEKNIHWRIQLVSRQNHCPPLAAGPDALLARSMGRWWKLRMLRSSR